MTLVWTIILFAHVVCATFWVGGQLMLTFVVLPPMRKSQRPEVVAQVAVASGRRFARIANRGLLPVLVVTGPLLAWHDGVRAHSLHVAFSRVLEVKVALVLVVLAGAMTHGVAVKRWGRRGARTAALITLGLSVAIVALAAALAVLPAPVA